MKRIAILGSTGSIGKSSLEVLRRNQRDFKVTALSTNCNIRILQRQINEFRPLCVCVKEKADAGALKSTNNSGIKIFSGEEGLLRILEDKRIDKVILAISGSAALAPLLKAIENNKDVALANKEALVMAGPIIMKKAQEKKVKIIPIDSEQSAIWQCLEGRDGAKLKNIYLTASGGPFRELNKREFKHISVKQALRHPRWKMGKKISVDSATLMNKGLEILETMYLFNLPAEKIKVIIHPESVIHSMVEYADGAVIAQLAPPDMRIPIQYALSYPARLNHAPARIDFYKLKQLNLARPDFKKFPCLGLAYRAARRAGTAPCALNAANEVSVDEFLKGRLDFISIPAVIEKVLDRHANKKDPGLGDILETDRQARLKAYRIINKLKK